MCRLTHRVLTGGLLPPSVCGLLDAALFTRLLSWPDTEGCMRCFTLIFCHTKAPKLWFCGMNWSPPGYRHPSRALGRISHMAGLKDPCLPVWSKTPLPTCLPDSRSHDFGERASSERALVVGSLFENVNTMSSDHGVFGDTLC